MTFARVSMKLDRNMTTRSLAAAFIAALAGVAVFCVLVLSGVLIYQRLFSGSAALLLVIALVAAGIGAYGGWLLGLIVFSALRAPDAEELETQ